MDVRAAAYLAAGVALPGAVLLCVFLYFAPPIRRVGMPVLLVALASWSLPLGAILVLPIDIASTLYRECLSHGTRAVGACGAPLVLVSSGALAAVWRALYWTAFGLMWVGLPVLGAAVAQPAFSVRGKLAGAMRVNMVYQLGRAALGIAAGVYLIVARQATVDGLLALAMAASNAYGLFLVAVLLGHGLARVPQRLWRAADPRAALAAAYADLPRARETWADEAARWAELGAAVAHEFRRHVGMPDVQQVVLGGAPQPPAFARGPPRRVAALPGLEPNQRALCQLAVTFAPEISATTPGDPAETLSPKQLLARVLRRFPAYDKARARYAQLLLRAWWLEDALASNATAFDATPAEIFGSGDVRFDGDRLYRDAWAARPRLWMTRRLRRPAFRVAAIGAGALSAALLWSEVAYPFDNPAAPRWNVLAAATALLADAATSDAQLASVQVLALALAAYMCWCTYSSLLRLRVLGGYSLVGRGHSDERSLLFFGTYLCRLTFPLCANLVLLVLGDTDRSEFTQLMGRANLVPVLGWWAQTYLPLLVACGFVASAANAHGVVSRGFSRVFGSGDDDVDPENDDETAPLLRQPPSAGKRIAAAERSRIQSQRALSASEHAAAHSRLQHQRQRTASPSPKRASDSPKAPPPDPAISATSPLLSPLTAPGLWDWTHVADSAPKSAT